MIVALDVGATAVRAAVVAPDGVVLGYRQVPTISGAGVGGVVDDLVAVARDMGSGALDAVGVVAPGVVDEASGTVVSCPALGWRDVPLRDLLTRRLGVPVAFGHDVRAAGLAHAHASGLRDFLFIPVGSGIAAAIVRDGRPVSGDHGKAGELGHLVVRPGGDACRCGSVGCLETVASLPSIAARYGAPGMTALDVAGLALEGDPLAGVVWADAVGALADALAVCATLLDPSTVVIGGALAGVLTDPLTEALARRLSFQSAPALVPSAHGSLAGCVGAGLLAADLVMATPSSTTAMPPISPGPTGSDSTSAPSSSATTGRR